MQKILFVSHCILNTAAKVVRYGDTGKKEEESRLEFVVKTVEQGIQLVFQGALQKNSGAYSHSDEGIYGTGRTGAFFCAGCGWH